MVPWKVAVAVAACIAAIVAGAYGTGYFTYLFLGIDGHPVHWNTGWGYIRSLDHPALAPFLWRIKLGIGVGCMLPGLAWIGVLVALLRHNAAVASVHGTARFATLRDLRKAGLLTRTEQSILIGKYMGHYLWLSGSQHVITISPTRSGKTATSGVPVALTFMGSMVILDIKGELYLLTSGRRQAMGQLIRVWAPYDEEGQTHRFNPMTLLAGVSAEARIGELQTIAAILYPDQPGTDPFWVSQSRAAFTAFASYLFESWDRKYPNATDELINQSEDFPSLERILRFSSGSNGRTTRETIAMLLKERADTLSPQTRTVFTNLAGLAGDTFSSVIATMQVPLQQFLNPILAAATNATDIDIRSLRRRLTTLFVIIPPQRLDESSKLLNIFFSTVIGNNLDKQLGQEPGLKHQVLMLMDEFTAMGRVDAWAKRISISASYGLRDLCIIQSRSQLRGTYGEHDAQNFITNHAAQVVFAPREQSDANEYSEMLGNTTRRRRQRNVSRGTGGRQVSTTIVEERRPLMLPQEIKELPADEQLIFYEGCRPIRATKNWYFKDRQLKKWAALPPVPMPRPHRAAAPPTTPEKCSPRTERGLASLRQRRMPA
jgi:type IV secretion system protein VirD4